MLLNPKRNTSARLFDVISNTTNSTSIEIQNSPLAQGKKKYQ